MDSRQSNEDWPNGEVPAGEVSSGRAPGVVFSGGGSGGHLMPAVAVAEELVARFPQCRIMFLTGNRPMDLQLSSIIRVPPDCLTIDHLPVPSLRSAFTRPWHFFPNMTRALTRAIRAIRQLKPVAVIGLGGIASVPGVIAGFLCRRPVILLEQNTTPGAATCWLSRFAHVLCEGLPLSHHRGLARGMRIVPTGIPLRREFLPAFRAKTFSERRQKQLLIVGGSQGASRLNRLVIDAFTILAEELSDVPVSEWKIIHQTGERDCEWVREAYRVLNLNATVVTFVEDPHQAMRDSQLIISRAGAVTIAELLATKSIAVLIPLQNVAREHQTENAKWYSQRTGQTWLVETDESAVQRLAEQIRLRMNSDCSQSDTTVNPQVAQNAFGNDSGVAGVIKEIARFTEET